ncbi:VPLPA-CTERM sorting domain-containing protein [Roseobacter ponti]|uniref:VPLPA-CTERM sorting domain-containing protein n=1 Tax=Roseobacter ponti TaxID=1891787 RepID=A0A858STH3_9RHOB|nr:VPLPA-CTERM sorting domain-containing protein [Roseobacter ponti]QJF52004.1 VPLPA-CTERM sorting domain-containing protein [Roseobacter ponti]
MNLFQKSAIALAMMSTAASASAIIDNDTIQLGVDDLGQLNVPGGAPSGTDGTTAVGLRFLPTGNESTSHGCLCEGWGVGIADTGVSGYANNSSGTANLTAVDFTSTASTAFSSVELTTGELAVTHSFAPAAETDNLYRVSVSITNTSGADINDLRYTRTFDWDIEPETFSELVTHAGVATTPSVLYADDNGFSNSNPFASRSAILGTGDFVNLGPADHGSNFDFGFGELLDGESFDFDIFYGAAATEAGALAALGEVGAELFSLGKCGSDVDGSGAGGCDTFIFGFSGVGGEIIVPDPTPPDEPGGGGPSPIPVPAGGVLLLTGLGVLGAARRFKKRKA